MYKPADKTQILFLDFKQPMGLYMNPDNRWIQIADKILRDLLEGKYAGLSPSDTDNAARLLRMQEFKDVFLLLFRWLYQQPFVKDEEDGGGVFCHCFPAEVSETCAGRPDLSHPG